ncbi:Aste57867_11140 [Aphanomyces stellatus]|uniref:Aste57867_11140 protein n=1 Tax=Aphanomyces stellatus TaxID=120398 RepID=A0A485KSN9_9STRA|nr:hypothetical protein As57867_011098 [Aphanomyces stellatus]VFT88007.1 Aste57867_11140 [Aphanomyces stellatus]
MGGCVSNEAYNAAVVVSMASRPVAVIDPKFALPVAITLHMKEHLWARANDPFVIKDPHTCAPYFRLQGQVVSMRSHKNLLDFEGHVVASMEEAVVALLGGQTIYSASRTKLCDAVVRFGMCHYRIECRVRNSCASGTTHAFELMSDGFGRKTVITCDGVVVARAYSPPTLADEEYFVDIGAGVDIALIVLLCVALEDHVAKSASD